MHDEYKAFVLERRKIVSVEEKDYSRFLIADFTFWSVYLHESQQYLGRCYIWCKRPGARDLTDATVEEWNELLRILKKVEVVLQEMFEPSLLNYSFLGNMTRHLHCHVIPRYEKPREFEGMRIVDMRFGHNYLTDQSFVTPPHVLEEIIEQMKKSFV